MKVLHTLSKILVLACCVTFFHASNAKIIPREIPFSPTQYFEVSLTGKDTNSYNGFDGRFFSSRLVTLGASFAKDDPDQPFILFRFMESTVSDAIFLQEIFLFSWVHVKDNH